MTQINDRLFTFDLGTSATSAINTDANNSVQSIIIGLPENCTELQPKISILEKIKRLTELQDPDLTPIQTSNSTSSTSNYDFISLLASNLGYQVDINREDMQYTGDMGNLAYLEDNTYSAVDVGKYLRFMVANLPNWYKIKTTRNAIKVLLYSFGLIGDTNPKYTSDYDKNWILYNELDKFQNIPDNYYPTPHFAVTVEIDNSVDEVSFDNGRRNNVVKAIESVRPVNTVFEGLNGHVTRVFDINININTNVKMYMVIN